MEFFLCKVGAYFNFQRPTITFLIMFCLFLHGGMWWSWSSDCPFAMVVMSSTMGIDHDDDFFLTPTHSRPSCYHHHYLPPTR